MSRTALLVMDLQNAIVDRIESNPEFLPRVQGVIAKARKASLTIIYVVVKFRPQFPEVSPKNKAFAASKSGGLPLQDGEPMVEIHSSVAPEAEDIVVTKRRVGAYSSSDLEVVIAHRALTTSS